MAIPYVHGPCHIYVSTAREITGSNPPENPPTFENMDSLAPDLLENWSKEDILYLGTCEQSPKIQINPRFKPLYGSVLGDDIPYDHLFMGEDAMITGVLTRWNEQVYRDLAIRPIRHDDDVVRGMWQSDAIGTMMLAEGKAFGLWLQFPYSASKDFGEVFRLRDGYHFFAAWMFGPDVISGGTGPAKRLMQIYAQPVYNPVDGAWWLYDEDTTFLPDVPPTTPDGVIP